MTYDPQKQHRRSIRLKGYDYSQAGAYFVTICAQNRECLFGEVIDAQLQLNASGQMIEKWWGELPHKFPTVELDVFVVMPNHFHGVLIITPGVRQPREGHPHKDAPTGSGELVGTTRRARAGTGQPHRVSPTLGDIMDWFKTMTTNEYIHSAKQYAWPRFAGKLWQRNYYEHIIRNQADLEKVRSYISDNPARWPEDENHPSRIEVQP